MTGAPMTSTGGAGNGGTLRAARVVLALGSNLGDRLRNLQGALDALFDTSSLAFLAVSGVYETVPAGGPAQPDYLNAVALAESRLPARVILQRCQAAEAAFGRIRGERWGPRTLDVDLIVYGDVVSDDPELILPHPRAHQRAFVLAPWLDVDPDGLIPGHGRVDALLETVGLAGVHRRGDSVLQSPV
jgi:2-amino-4-hydroxy-6-hydroxymethyldihydropteridine diphosphokinase